MAAKNKILVLYAHPAQHHSEVNSALFNIAKKISGVTAVDLYYDYPTFDIDTDKEQQRLLEHDVIVFQFPLYWYSTPSLLKEWQDLVLEYDFAYGEKGTALKDKIFFCAVSAGGKEESYQAAGDNHSTLRELLLPLEQTANLAGMIYLPPFALFGSRAALESNRIRPHGENWRHLLKALINNKLDIESAQKGTQLNHALKTINKTANSRKPA